MTNHKQIAVSIPLALESRESIASALENKYGTDYVFLGRIFQNKLTNKSCFIDIHKEKKTNSLNRFNTSVTQHHNLTTVVSLTSNDVGYAACVQMARFAQLFLDIGGTEVRVASTGIICDRQKWTENYSSQDVFDIYSLFVTLVEADSYYYSCGMKNFGLADVSIDIAEDAGLAIYVMNVFNYYRLTDSVILRDKETFQPDLDCPVYKMTWGKQEVLEIDRLLDNPWGKWHLNRVSDYPEIDYQIS